LRTEDCGSLFVKPIPSVRKHSDEGLQWVDSGYTK
jgi:hypothetical protein